jgi:hypothetical protein
VAGRLGIDEIEAEVLPEDKGAPTGPRRAMVGRGRRRQYDTRMPVTPRPQWCPA